MSIWVFIAGGAALASIITEGFKKLCNIKNEKLKPFIYALIAVAPSFIAGIVISKLFPMQIEDEWAQWVGIGSIVYVIQYIAGITITKKLGDLISKKLDSV